MNKSSNKLTPENWILLQSINLFSGTRVYIVECGKILKIFMTSGKCFTGKLLAVGETNFSSFRYMSDEIWVFF